MINKSKYLELAIVGMGYVGLPLALAFSKKRKVICYDINKNRISKLQNKIDENLDFSKKDLKKNKNLYFTYNKEDIRYTNCYIITVPTPVNKFNKPNLKPLINATKTISRYLKKNDIVIYESTVYPGCIEEVCVPILEEISKLNFNKDFFCGYSPERINPGDKKHTLTKIKKITSGSKPEIANLIDDLYKEIIEAGTFKASSIRVAEAAKVIENTQRDLNIALINELSMLFKLMNIDTQEVLEAAGTKWNFLNFKPGLVGGHCIGVDPYYLTYKAKKIGYDPKIILAGRDLNNKMGDYVVSQLVTSMKNKNIKTIGAKILIMGLTFKENCPDIRNSGVTKIITKLKKYNCKLDLFDPYVNRNEIKKKYNIYPKERISKNKYDAVLISVAHNKFKSLGINKIKKSCKANSVIFDLKNIFNSNLVDFTL